MLHVHLIQAQIHMKVQIHSQATLSLKHKTTASIQLEEQPVFYRTSMTLGFKFELLPRMEGF